MMANAAPKPFCRNNQTTRRGIAQVRDRHNNLVPLGREGQDVQSLQHNSAYIYTTVISETVPVSRTQIPGYSPAYKHTMQPQERVRSVAVKLHAYERAIKGGWLPCRHSIVFYSVPFKNFIVTVQVHPS